MKDFTLDNISDTVLLIIKLAIIGWSLLIPILIIVCLPLYVWNLLAICLARIVNPDYTLISGTDSFFVQDDGVETEGNVLYQFNIILFIFGGWCCFGFSRIVKLETSFTNRH